MNRHENEACIVTKSDVTSVTEKTMEAKKFRVEVFITPRVNDADDDKFVNNFQLDVTDESQANSELEHDENSSDKVADSRDNFYTDEKIYDEPFVGNMIVYNEKYNDVLRNTLNNSDSKFRKKFYPKPPKRTSSLKPIDERVEYFEQNIEEFCYHGHKNGCTVAVQQPEELSQEIFKENWLQKLEALRQREALLRDKELALQSQERLLFKKERQLRILERLVKDKMRQIEMYLKRCKNIQGFDYVRNERSSESGFSNSSKHENVDDTKDLNHIYAEIKNPPNSRSSLTSTSSESKEVPYPSVVSEKPSRFNTHNSSFRLKPKPKLRYDDMDSTLSADIGDRSFAPTSRKFDPEVIKKPAAFCRSASERKPSWNQKVPSVVPAQNEHHFQESKILRKFSENILVSKSKETKFQNYGIIDDRLDAKSKSSTENESSSSKKYSYLDLDSGTNSLKTKSKKSSKERPNSWSAETDNWLQKKRQAYNMSMRKSSTEKREKNKENATDQNKAKKEKGRKFMIFR